MFATCFKNSILLVLGTVTLTTSGFAFAQSGAVRPAPAEFSCVAREGSERFPSAVKFQITSLDQLEASATYKDGRGVVSASLKRLEIGGQPKVAVFPVGGAIGVSGEAKILISKDALRFGEVGTIMLINQSTRDSVDYQCQKLAPAVVAIK